MILKSSANLKLFIKIFKHMTKFINLLISFLVCFITISGQSQTPNDWYYGNPGEGFNGISMHKAYAEFLKDKATRPIVVAIIDSGVDANHEDLKANMWINTGEIAGNGKDDDGNGYIDDIHGWNFIGGPGGMNVGADTYEFTRVYASLRYKYENADVSKLNKDQQAEYAIFKKAKESLDADRAKAESGLSRINALEMKVMDALDIMKGELGDKDLNLDNVSALDESKSQELAMAKMLATQYLTGNTDINNFNALKNAVGTDINSDKKRYQDQLDYAFNPDFDPRKTIVMDNYNDPNEKYYGNTDIIGPDALHGTHVAGIVGAVRNNEVGMDGVATNVKIMSVRTVPDGDERDKDVANAIRYAVDNGASVINMSFGKGFGTHKDLVDEAVRYAESKDVLLVHAAGNSAQNNDITDNFPNAQYNKKTGFLFFKKKRKAKNWIEVGALSFKEGEDAVAPFSNYGQNNVDVFAPGMRIYSTMPFNEYAQLQGTSMAAPVVAGVAAVIRSVYPKLTAEQVKEAIMNSSLKLNHNVKVPGKPGELAHFSKLSVSGGTVNLYDALVYASNMKGKKKS